MSWLYATLILLSPLYIWRFELVGLPTNFLLSFAVLVIVLGFAQIIIKSEANAFAEKIADLPKLFLGAVALFFFSSIVSLFIGGIDLPKIGQWLVLYLTPILVASQAYYFSGREEGFREKIVLAVYFFLFCSGIMALLQYFWLVGLPVDFWGNSAEPKRAVGFFIHPNNFALYITPLLAFLLPDLKQKIENFQGRLFIIQFWPVIAWGLGGVGLFLSLSRGGWLGLAMACGIFVLFSSSKKILLGFLGLGVIAIVIVSVVPNLRYRLLLPFHGEKSSVARISLMQTGWKMVKDSPVLGQGINGFNYNWDKFNTDPNLDHYNFPHNFILNAWVDTGLLGLLSWLVIVGFGIWYGFKNRSKTFALGLALFLIALLAHGLIDIPYFKNDLAMVFWLAFALAL